jgi:uncharacterized protein YgiM (DUF1202 family)
MKRKAMITWFIIVFVVCFTGIIASTIMIDNLIDSYIKEIKTEVNIEVINNTNNEVAVEDRDGNIKVYINPETEEEVTEETTVFEQKEVTVITNKGLNIRKEPDISSEVVGTINYGGEVTVINEVDGWYETTDGFIKTDYVE